MKYDRFEDLPVWKAAQKLAVEVFAFTEHQAFRLKGSLRNQLERAVLSISNNIAEGFERGTTNELLSFLYISRGSAGEVRSMLCFIEQLPEFQISDLKFEISRLKSSAESISRQLRGWADSLQDSDIRGQRFLNDDRRKAQAKKARATFMEELHRAQEANIASRVQRAQSEQENH